MTMMTLDTAIQIVEDFTSPTVNADTRAPTFRERCAIRKVLRSAKEARTQSEIIRSVCAKAIKAVDKA